MNPVTAQQAALRILLEDVEPLLQRAEAVATILSDVRIQLDADLTSLEELVQRTIEAQPVLLEVGKRLAGSAARIESAVQQTPVALSLRAPKVMQPLGSRWTACIASAVLSAAVVAGVYWFNARELLEQARIGRALQIAWPLLDQSARAKVNAVLGIT